MSRKCSRCGEELDDEWPYDMCEDCIEEDEEEEMDNLASAIINEPNIPPNL